jgi:hypothetical protein
MDSPVQPSFIPHDAGVATGAPRSSSGLRELLLLLSIVLLVVSAALGAGVFLYTQYLQSAEQSKLAQLNRAEAAFDPSLIQQITRLDTRMHAASALLSAHLAPTQLFAMLEQTTAQDISFNSFSYDSTNPQQITIKMAGVAGSVNSVALQAQLFSQSGMLTSPIFSGIDSEQDGVHFDFTAFVNPTDLSYETLITGAPPTTPLPQSQATGQTSVFEGSSSSSSSQAGAPYPNTPAQQ